MLAAERADLDLRPKERTSYLQLSSELQGATPTQIKSENNFVSTVKLL